jgi:hypothetical protein
MTGDDAVLAVIEARVDDVDIQRADVHDDVSRARSRRTRGAEPCGRSTVVEEFVRTNQASHEVFVAHAPAEGRQTVIHV